MICASCNGLNTSCPDGCGRKPNGELDGSRCGCNFCSSETIVAAAIRIPTGETWRSKEWNGRRSYPDFLTITAPPPARHHTLMHPLSDVLKARVAPENQGFLTSRGRYVDREEAHAIAVASGQPMIDHPSRIDGTLYSEDLW